MFICMPKVEFVILFFLEILHFKEWMNRQREGQTDNHDFVGPFAEFISEHQKPVYSINFFVRYNQFYISATRVGTPIYDHVHPNIFQSTVISVNLYQQAKKQTFSSFCSRDSIDLKILQSDWPTTFWHISQEPKFSKIFPCIHQYKLIDKIEKKDN